MYWWAAISIGLLGSAHCAGMCGPLLLAANQGRSLKNSLLHHGGRLFTYAVFGSVAGAIGTTFSVLGVQQQFSIIVGALMVLSVLLIPVSKYFSRIEMVMSTVALKFSSWIHAQGFSANALRLLGGVGNGLLPCGLVYLGIAGAANTFTPWDGALFMLLFGLGTLPVLLVFTFFGNRLSAPFRSQIRRLIPITIFVMGALLMVRGMNLGIPYLSPAQQQESSEIAECH